MALFTSMLASGERTVYRMPDKKKKKWVKHGFMSKMNIFAGVVGSFFATFVFTEAFRFYL